MAAKLTFFDSYRFVLYFSIINGNWHVVSFSCILRISDDIYNNWQYHASFYGDVEKLTITTCIERLHLFLTIQKFQHISDKIFVGLLFVM